MTAYQDGKSARAAGNVLTVNNVNQILHGSFVNTAQDQKLVCLQHKPYCHLKP